MASQDKKDSSDAIETVGEMPVRSTADEFAADEMLQCPVCARSTPPNRLDCVYCGAELETGDAQAKKIKPALRPPEGDEPGFDLVLMPGNSVPSEESLRTAATVTRLDEARLAQHFGLGSAVPIARSGSRKAVEIAVDRLTEAGIDSKIFDDARFKPEVLPRRIRGISLGDDGLVALTLFGSGETETVPAEKISLVVTGRITNRRVESREKRNRKGKQKVVATTESADDELYIDIYTAEATVPYRIQVSGFDFSFLGKEMELLASANIVKAARYIRDLASEAKFDDSYDAVRPLLDEIWPPDERGDTRSVKRLAFGSFERDRLLTVSNIGQFTKYSKLQWLTREE